jgi:hypothetical protein
LPLFVVERRRLDQLELRQLDGQDLCSLDAHTTPQR